MAALPPDTHSGNSLAPRALYVEVAERLRQRIFSQQLEPGSWIDELRHQPHALA
jgi:DNA-binding GntR family transcriptional regulator